MLSRPLLALGLALLLPAGALTVTTTTAAAAPVSVTGGTTLPGRSATATGPVGVTFGLSDGTRNGGPYNGYGNTIFNLPMYLGGADRTKFWDNYVEELVASGVDFVAPVLRGYTPGSAVPNGGGDPRLLAELVQAINRRGVADQLKIAAFDDTPASMTDRKNLAVHNRGGYDPPFDLADTTGTGEGGYQYIWDNNLRAFFTAVPDNLRFKIDGRPVVYEWSLSNTFFVNQGNGNAAKMLQYVRDRAKAEFGADPFFNLDQTWMQLDPTVSTVAGGMNAWFNMPNGGRSLVTFNGRSYGVAVPGFRMVRDTTNMVIEPNHGQTFANNLNATVNAGAAATLVEGFTDWEENAAVWRMAAGTYAERLVDYPNQMLNVLRRYSRNPFPTDLRVEAETADSHQDSTPGNLWSEYRAGDLDVQTSLDAGGGWNVGSVTSGEWLQWQEVPLQNTVTLKARVATPNPDTRFRFVVDGVAGPTITTPNTGDWQTYQTVDAGTFSLPAGKYHTVRLEFLGGSLNINYWQAVATTPTTPTATATATPKPTATATPKPTASATPTATPSRTGQIVGYEGKCIDIAGAKTANGTAVQLYDCNGTAAQKWTVAADGTIRGLGKCMDLTSAGTANGTQVQLYDCNGTTAQKWQAGANNRLVNPKSGRCLDATGPSSANGTRLQIWDCAGSANQQWILPSA
ncbi:DUF5010 domain-containing protein [Micromonospora sp. NPDC049366]|uniref:DUF5010 domain-containing protein n=1 Tax=Micromonospora sp. NPDC049366 TaxID=3364271 RepID=UPI0037A5139E